MTNREDLSPKQILMFASRHGVEGNEPALIGFIRDVLSHGVCSRDVASILSAADAALAARDKQVDASGTKDAQPVAPRWYTRDEIVFMLKSMNYCDQIAEELADWALRHLQLAFNKGFEVGIRDAQAESGANKPTPQQISDYLNGLDRIERELVEHEARAAAPQAQGVAEGWALVPIEPTPEMQIPSYLPHVDWPTRKRIYKEMIAAAPSREHVGETKEDQDHLTTEFARVGEEFMEMCSELGCPNDTNMLVWARGRMTCDTCHGTGRMFVGRSGLESDGNAPEFERCPSCGYADASPSRERANSNPPYSNCSFRICDLPGQCRSEGKCHHPARESGDPGRPLSDFERVVLEYIAFNDGFINTRIRAEQLLDGRLGECGERQLSDEQIYEMAKDFRTTSQGCAQIDLFDAVGFARALLSKGV